MQTVNGKLVLEEPNEIEIVKTNIESLDQRFDRLESQLVSLKAKEKKDCLEKLEAVKLSLQQLEQIYKRLLATTIVTTIGLTGGYFWLFLNHQSSPKTPQKNTVSIESIERQ